MVVHDGKLDIALGLSRNTKTWKNRTWLWSQLLEKMSKTNRTHETLAEYAAMDKARQDEVKDVGAFVGGYLDGGKRSPTSVVHRQILVLDLDFGTSGHWDDFTMFYHNAGAMYTTHKHSPNAWRVRIVMPLSRPVDATEYQAIGRRVADNLNIEYFDNTGFQHWRLMYWPSTSSDGEFLFFSQDGPWLNVDEVLATYHNYKDVSAWPISSRYQKALHTSMAKQGDPLEKPGHVGAFCRTYTIEAAIEAFLPDVYEKVLSNVDGVKRWTFKGGSTAAGAVEYDDKFLYSHHGTDPISGKLCNAFDLIRIHKFGLLDEDQPDDTPANRKRSYTAMVDFCVTIPAVRGLIASERTNTSRDAFMSLMGVTEIPQSETDSDEWKSELDVDRRGNIQSTIDNVLRVLNNDPLLRGKLALNLFDQREVVLGDLPWRKMKPAPDYMTDTDDAGLRNYMEKVYGIASGGKVQDGLKLALLENSIHPVKDYLLSCEWDGVPRIETIFIDYMGAEDTQYMRQISRKWLIGAIARIFEPGCKFDNTVMLMGTEGIGKSTIFNKLGGAWYSDSFTTMQGKDAFESVQGVWIVEMAELVGLSRSEANAAKHFMSKRSDRYRVAYGKRTEDFPRTVAFAATTNEDDPLLGENGDRRIWPVKTMVNAPTLNVLTMDAATVAQIWGEARNAYESGEVWYLDRETEAEARQVQQAHIKRDDRAGMMLNFINRKVPKNWDTMTSYERRNWLTDADSFNEGVNERGIITAAEIWVECFGGTAKDMSGFNTKYIHNFLKNLKGWHGAKGRVSVPNYGRQIAYIRDGNHLNLLYS